MALAVHLALVFLPVTLDPVAPDKETPVATTTLDVTLTALDAPPKVPDTPTKLPDVTPEIPQTTTPLPTAKKESSAILKPQREPRAKVFPAVPDKASQASRDQPSAPSISTANTPKPTRDSFTPPPSNDGAKSRSTVFDPGLSTRLETERNRVRKFESRDVELTTNNGTFFQKGDRCWEEKKLLPGDIDSTVSQRFLIKCTQRKRSEEDIGRLADKYGIP
ncbi:hypothetical protein PVT68_04450 [Microbulbifer bruguierae]|uniref:Uncharacterized protein n=1 Tax=Microbulbifer bruguierae TaxID=3029061 RepID=A0ABY8NFU0_9GAMM|nr:hypothetical protein [Microbulbifer bruguierae]WGL17545.1 hypothetical protein PVT68_04450 [Microbulbifer bruguierae]